MEQGKQKEEGGKENLEKDTHMKINEKKGKLPEASEWQEQIEGYHQCVGKKEEEN